MPGLDIGGQRGGGVVYNIIESTAFFNLHPYVAQVSLVFGGAGSRSERFGRVC